LTLREGVMRERNTNEIARHREELDRRAPIEDASVLL